MPGLLPRVLYIRWSSHRICGPLPMIDHRSPWTIVDLLEWSSISSIVNLLDWSSISLTDRRSPCSIIFWSIVNLLIVDTLDRRSLARTMIPANLSVIFPTLNTLCVPDLGILPRSWQLDIRSRCCDIWSRYCDIHSRYRGIRSWYCDIRSWYCAA